MKKLWHKLFGGPPQPALRPPVSRRLKTYSAASGYVYQYRSAGSREGKDGPEYLFEVSRDRRPPIEWAVVLPDALLEAFASSEGRSLSSPERFGIAKVTLQFEMDSASDWNENGRKIECSPQEMREAIQYLGIA